jgi:hypothetical protein
MPAAMLTPDRPPPEDYYQNNCRTLFAFVLEHYADLLADDVARQLQIYLDLADDAQRLFARLLTRKGPLIRIDSLKYAEVADLTAALALLGNSNLIQLNAVAPADQLMSMLKKAEVISLAAQPVPKSARKNEVVELHLSRYTDAQIYQQVSTRHAWLKISAAAVWDLVRLLYFGDTHHDWSSFVIRDLGMVRYEPWRMITRRFADPQMLETDLLYRRLSDLTHRIAEHPDLAYELTTLLQNVVADRFIQSRRDRALMRIGHWHEQAGDADGAVQVYATITVHPARERIVRVLHRHGHEQAAQQWLHDIKQQPYSEEEAQFAERFGKRQAGYQPPVTQIDIDVAEANIEGQALDLVLRPGEWGAHVENSLVRTLTGLVYWDVLFADITGAFTNPFQAGPNDLYRDDFFTARQDIVDTLESALKSDLEFERHLVDVFARKQGVANSLVNWSMFSSFELQDVLDAMPIDDIRRLTEFLIRNLHSRRAGLPDLFVVHGPKQYEFIEVKGPNDQLQPGQRIWFKHFDRLNIPARLLKLRLVT